MDTLECIAQEGEKTETEVTEDTEVTMEELLSLA